MKRIGMIVIAALAAGSLLAHGNGNCDMKEHAAASAEQGKSCDMKQHQQHRQGAAATAAGCCDMKKSEAASTATACSVKEGRAVEMTGKLLCRHCNLHQTDHCEKVFQPASDTAKLYPICAESKGDLEALSEEGTATLKLKGKLVQCGEHGEELLIEEISKI